ncbi:hypothetical protein HELRODRAFT_103091, partial [Helobdella robusta]|uniref:Uncharacterized protein n=1 Tax=Helobdella robusta TaxID=6412 RepID=T1EDE3_HELRO
MIQAIKDCDVIKLNSVLNNRGSYSRKELNFCFFSAAQSGGVECLKCLLTCNNLDLNVSNSSGKTALMLSAENGHADIISALLSDGRCKVDKRNENSGQIALHFAVKSNNFECSKRLLEAGANMSVKDFEGNTPLLLLSHQRMPNLALMKLLTGCCINAQNNQGQTALHLTSFRAIGAELLLASGADANLQDSSGNTPLHIASIEGLDAIVICLITYNCNVNISNIYGKLALHYLAMKGHDACIEAISKVGGDLNLTDKDNKSPLVYSI